MERTVSRQREVCWNMVGSCGQPKLVILAHSIWIPRDSEQYIDMGTPISI
jgi:hypothetical protein